MARASFPVRQASRLVEHATFCIGEAAFLARRVALPAGEARGRPRQASPREVDASGARTKAAPVEFQEGLRRAGAALAVQNGAFDRGLSFLLPNHQGFNHQGGVFVSSEGTIFIQRSRRVLTRPPCSRARIPPRPRLAPPRATVEGAEWAPGSRRARFGRQARRPGGIHPGGAHRPGGAASPGSGFDSGRHEVKRRERSPAHRRLPLPVG
jgi:hypothetical protein